MEKVESILCWSAIGSASLFAILGVVAIVTGNREAMLTAAIILGISILLTISLLVYAALPRSSED